MWTVIAIATGWLAVGLLATIPFGAIAWFGSGETPDEGAILFDEFQEREYGA